MNQNSAIFLHSDFNLLALLVSSPDSLKMAVVGRTGVLVALLICSLILNILNASKTQVLTRVHSTRVQKNVFPSIAVWNPCIKVLLVGTICTQDANISVLARK